MRALRGVWRCVYEDAMTGWFGFFAPKGTPRTAIGKLNAAMVKAPADPRAHALRRAGPRCGPRSLEGPEGLAAFRKVEIEAWWPIIKAAGFQSN